MDLVNRYLQAVKFWLPTKQKEDIAAELAEDLRSQIEEQEERLGRKLNEAEVAEVLKRRGRPVLVANRYLPQQYLIGPALFPIYWFVVKIVALCYLAPWILVWIGLISFSSSYRAGHRNLFESVLSAWSSWWMVAMFALGMVTLVFAVLERVQAKRGFLEDWEPRKLPPVRDPNEIRRGGTIIEIVANLVFGIGWWSIYMSSPLILDRPELRIMLSPTWHYFFWGFLGLSLVSLALSVANLARPYWTGLRASLRLLIDCTGAVLFCFIMKAHIFAQITVPNLSAERMSEITNAINLWMERALPFAIVVGVAIAVGDLYRIYRVKKNGRPATQDLATAVV